MGSVVDSLKRLYKKIGGGKVKGPIAIDDLVDKIADQMSSGSDGSGSGESKEVLTVIVRIDSSGWDEEEHGYYPTSVSHTFDQIKDAYDNGKQIICLVKEGTYKEYALPLAYYETGYCFAFSAIEFGGSSPSNVNVTIKTYYTNADGDPFVENILYVLSLFT